MDADDVSHPGRLRAQWELLRTRPEVSLVGPLWEGIDREGRWSGPGPLASAPVHDLRRRSPGLHHVPARAVPHHRRLSASLQLLGGPGPLLPDGQLGPDHGSLRRFLPLPISIRINDSSQGTTRSRMRASALMYRCVDHLRNGQDSHVPARGGLCLTRAVVPRFPPCSTDWSGGLWAGETHAILKYMRGGDLSSARCVAAAHADAGIVGRGEPTLAAAVTGSVHLVAGPGGLRAHPRWHRRGVACAASTTYWTADDDRAPFPLIGSSPGFSRRLP